MPFSAMALFHGRFSLDGLRQLQGYILSSLHLLSLQQYNNNIMDPVLTGSVAQS